MTKISPRQQIVLSCVVETHIETAAPVSSCLLRDRYQMEYSPATLRNEMGALEECGYLTQPHTSSGRVPTDRGYRYYVDHALDPLTVNHGSAENFTGNLFDFSPQADEAESLYEEVSRFMAAAAREASLVFLPGNQHRSTRVKLYFQGSAHMLEKPEFQDIRKLRNLFRLFEEKDLLAECISSLPATSDVSIRIGQENEPEAFHDCSVISARYDLPEGMFGTIAIVGPKRMRYSQTIPLVSRMAAIMNQILDERISG